MKEIKNSSTKILLLLVFVCMIKLSGCAYTLEKKESIRAIPEGSLSISHPTIKGYECWPTGHIQKIEDDIDICLNEDKSGK